MINRANKQTKHILFLACALLMLVLPVINLVDCQSSVSKPSQNQDTIFKPETGMISDIGLAGVGQPGESKEVLKPFDTKLYTKGVAHSSFRTAAEEKHGVTALAFRYILKTTQIHVQNVLFQTSLCCRAPPVFSKL